MLTLAIAIMAGISLLMLTVAPSTIRIVAPGFDAESQARYLDLFRLMLLTPIVFAASITLGEVLVAERHFLYYALAPILYNVGIVAGTLLFHARLGIEAAAVGAVIGSFLHLGIRLIGMTRTTVPSPVPARPAHARAPRVRPAHGAQDGEPPDRAADVPVLHQRRVDAGGRQRVGGQLRPQLPERARGTDRRRDLGRRLPDAVDAWAAGDRTGVLAPVRSSATTIVVVSDGRRGRARSSSGRWPSTSCSVVGPSTPTTSALTATVLVAFAISVPFDAIGHLTGARPVRDAQHAAAARSSRWRGFAVTIVTTLALVDRVGVVAIPLGFAAGTAVRTVLQAVALA